MNLKVKAALWTVALFGMFIGAAFLIEWIFMTFSANQIAFFAQCFGVGCITYAVYGIILTKLEMDENLKKMEDSL